MSKHVVTAPLVIVKDEAGAQHYHYQNAILPSYVSAEDLSRLTEDGLIAQVKEESQDAAPQRVMAAGDDPGDFKVDEVQAYLASADEDEKTRVLEAEAAGKNRSSITGS